MSLTNKFFDIWNEILVTLIVDMVIIWTTLYVTNLPMDCEYALREEVHLQNLKTFTERKQNQD